MTPAGDTAQVRDDRLKQLEELFGDAQMARAPYEGDWYLNVAYFEGEQWLCWDGARLSQPKLRKGRILVTDNRIQPAVRTEIAKMTKQRPAWDCTPDGPSEKAVEGARHATRVMDAKWAPDELALGHKLKRALLWSRVCGAGFWKITWDSTLGAGRDVLVGPDGKVARGDDEAPLDPRLLDALPEGHPLLDALSKKTVNRGDVRVEVRSPFEFFPDPLAESLEDMERCFEEVVLSPARVKFQYDVDLKPDADYVSGMIEARLSKGKGKGTRKRGVRVREMWEKATPERPRGRHVVWACNRILVDEANPYFDSEERPILPYGMFPGIDVPGRFWPTSVVEQLRPVQTELNKTKSQIAENRNRFGNPTMLKSRQANIRMYGIPGEIVEFDDTTQNAIPQYLQPPEMPGYVQNEIEMMQQAIQEISGQHEVSSGTVPAGVTAAAAINLLQQQDDTRLGPEVTDMEAGISLAGQQVMWLISRFYTEERIVRITGEDESIEFLNFTGEQLGTRVRVTEGSMKPKSAAAKQAALQDVLNLMIQYGMQIDQRALRTFFKEWEVGGLEALLGDLDRDEAQVNREHRRMYTGEPVEVDALVENLEAHASAHREEMKTARYEDAVRANPAIADIFRAHLQATIDAAAQQQNTLAAPPGVDPSMIGGGPAIGGAPPADQGLPPELLAALTGNSSG